MGHLAQTQTLPITMAIYVSCKIMSTIPLTSTALSPSQAVATFQPNISQHCFMPATCCAHWATLLPRVEYLLSVANPTSAQALARHCCTNLAKWLQHHATSIKFDHFQTRAINTQHVATSRNTVAKRVQRDAPNSEHCSMWSWNVVIVWPGLLTLSGLLNRISVLVMENTFNDFIVCVWWVYSSLCCFIEQVALLLTTLLFLPKKVRPPVYKLLDQTTSQRKFHNLIFHSLWISLHQ